MEPRARLHNDHD